MIEIREATETDAPLFLKLTKEFHEYVKQTYEEDNPYETSVYDEERIIAAFCEFKTWFIEQDGKPIGVFSATDNARWFDGVSILYEMFIYVEEGHRSPKLYRRILDTLSDYAKDIGAELMMTTTINNSSPNSGARFLNRYGMLYLETWGYRSI